MKVGITAVLTARSVTGLTRLVELAGYTGNVHGIAFDLLRPLGRAGSREVAERNSFIIPSLPARLRRIFADRLAVLGVLLLAGFVLVGVFAPYLAPHDPVAVDLGKRLLPSGTVYPLGADHLGRCVLSSLIWGKRVSLSTSFLVLLTIMGIGTPCGMLAGWQLLGRGMLPLARPGHLPPGCATSLTLDLVNRIAAYGFFILTFYTGRGQGFRPD